MRRHGGNLTPSPLSLMALFIAGNGGRVVAQANDDLIALIDAHVPRSGVLVVRYDAKPPLFGTMLGGYDFGADAFYFINNGLVFGRNANGDNYYGDDTIGGTHTDDRRHAAISFLALDACMTVHHVDRIRDHPELVRAVVRDANQGFIVTMALPMLEGETEEQLRRIRLDSTARVTSTQWLTGELPVITYDYAETEVMVPILASPDTRWQLTSAAFDPVTDAALFARDRVEKFAFDSMTRFVPPRVEVTKETPIPASSAGYRGVVEQGRTLARWRVPLMTTGGVLAALGIFAWLRRR